MNKGALGNTVPPLVPPGVIWEYVGTTLPDPAVYGKWLWADGSAVSRAEHAALFKVVGVQHGAGDGSTTFNLPDRRGNVGVGRDGTSDFLTIGLVGGSKTSTANHTHAMATHDHGSTAHGHGMENHYHGGGNHTHTVNSHGHNLDNHSHGGGTGVHAHRCYGNVYVSGTPAHGHDGAGDQSCERPNVTTGFSSPGNITSNEGQGNSGQGNSETPGTSGAVSGSGDWVWGYTGGQPTSGANVTGATNVGAAQASSVGVATGNLQPYITVNYIVKA